MVSLGQLERIINDFQKRAKDYEKQSRWVTDDNVLDVPLRYLIHRKTLGNLLDAGGGTGYLSHFLTKRIDFDTITLLDICDDMLKEAERKKMGAKIINSSIESFCKEVKEKFDTILIRQVLHYVEDVNRIFSLLKSVLKKNGVIYVGQFLETENNCREWHYTLEREISTSRQRTILYDEFLEYLCQNEFEIIQESTTELEGNIASFYERRINDELSYKELLDKMIALANERIKDNTMFRITNDNIYYRVKFYHFLLMKKE